MPGLAESLVIREIESLGWKWTRRDPQTLRCHLSTSEGKMTIFVRLMEAFVVASVVPFLRTQGDNTFELSRWLLRMNRDMAMAKFAYDEDGDVLLTVELATETLVAGELRRALESLLRSATAHRRTLRIAAEA